MKLLYFDPAVKESRPFDLNVVGAVCFGREKQVNQVVLRCRKDNGEEDRDRSIKISRRHMEIVLQEGRAVIIDRGSKKGTFLNDRQLAANMPVPLSAGDLVKISDVVHLRIDLQSDEVRVIREEPKRTSDVGLTRTDVTKASKFSQSDNLETSVMVVLFTDQVGSTEMAEMLGEKAFHKLRRKRDKIQTEIVQRDEAGRIIKSTGDGILAVFKVAQTALERVVEIQRTLRGLNQTAGPNEQIQMRIGLDLGQVVIDRQFSFDVFGMHVNRAARVMSQAGGGEILLTKAIHDLVKGWMSKPDLSFLSLGEVELKGISEKVHLYRLVYDLNTAATAPPSRR